MSSLCRIKTRPLFRRNQVTYSLPESPVRLTFVQPNGSREIVVDSIGKSIMDFAMDSGVEGIEAQCGGAGICTTCHCYFDERVFARLPMANEDEREMLSYISNRKKTSRLTCQIPVVTEYDGFVIYVAPRELR